MASSWQCQPPGSLRPSRLSTSLELRRYNPSPPCFYTSTTTNWPLDSPACYWSRRISRCICHLPAITQHHFYHWLHIRSLYESHFGQYVVTGCLLPLDIDSQTATAFQPMTIDSYHIQLTTTTSTVMPHATATTTTCTHYQQLKSDWLRLPPSPPLLASDKFVPPAPFSYEYAYPSHPFGYPPAAVLDGLPLVVSDVDMAWMGHDEETYNAQRQCDCRGTARDRQTRRLRTNKDVQQREDAAVNDSNDEWLVDGNRTETASHSSYASSYALS